MSKNKVGLSLIEQLKRRKTLPPLMPIHVWHPSIDDVIASFSLIQLADGKPEGLQSALAWKAALHLWNDSLDAAHELVQDLETSTGSALHGIMHRREGDYDNAKYWFHRAGDHPAFHSLQIRAASFIQEQHLSQGPLQDVFGQIALQGSWNPYLFINAVSIQESRIGDDNVRSLLEQLQQLELEAFIRFLEGRITLQI